MLADYVSGLEHDFSIVSCGVRYFVNGSVFSSVSERVRQLISEGCSEVFVDFEGSCLAVPLVARFVNGYAIDVNGSNDVELKLCGETLGLSAIVSLADVSLKSEVCMSNIFSRLSRFVHFSDFVSDSVGVYDDFLGLHADDLSKDERVFDLPSHCLSVIIHSCNLVKDIVGWRFIFECWKRFPDRLSDLGGSESELASIPFFAFEELVTCDSYSCLDSIVPLCGIFDQLTDDIPHCYGVTCKRSSEDNSVRRLDRAEFLRNGNCDISGATITSVCDLSQYISDIVVRLTSILPEVNLCEISPKRVTSLRGVVSDLGFRLNDVASSFRDISESQQHFCQPISDSDHSELNEIVNRLSRNVSCLEEIVVDVHDNTCDIEYLLNDLYVISCSLQDMCLPNLPEN